MLLLVQYISSLLHHRHYSERFERKMKILLKEKSSTVRDDADLFGKEFKNFITENKRAKNQTMAVHKLGKQIKPFQSGSSRAYGPKTGGVWG